MDGAAVSLQADWACAWIRVDGVVDQETITRVARAVEMACEARPRKVRLLLKGASYRPEDLEDLLSLIRPVTVACQVKLVAHTSRTAEGAWYRRVLSRRGDPASRLAVGAAA